MLAGIFVSSGVEAIRDPETLAKQADDVAPAIARALGLPTTDTVTLVRVNGAIQLTAGTLLAFGKFRRLSALALAASLIPTTYAAHRFWDEADPDERARQQKQFLKNAAMLGGLILAAGDTGGRPSLPWTARKVAHRGLETSAAAATSLTESGSKLREEAAAGIAVAATQAAELSRRAAKAAHKADLAKRATAGGELSRRAAKAAHKADLAELTKRATERARKAAKEAEVSKRAARAAKQAADVAQKADLADLTKRVTKAAEKAAGSVDLADLTKRAGKVADSLDLADLTKRTRRAARRAAKAARKSAFSRRARRAAHRAVKAARKAELSERAALAAAKVQQATLYSRDSAATLARGVAERTREALPIGG